MNLNLLKAKLNSALNNGALTPEILRELTGMAKQINLPERNLKILISVEQQKRQATSIEPEAPSVKHLSNDKSKDENSDGSEFISLKKKQQAETEPENHTPYQGKFMQPEKLRNDATGQLFMAEFEQETVLLKRRPSEKEKLLETEFAQTRNLAANGLLLPTKQGHDTFGAYLLYPFRSLSLLENALKNNRFANADAILEFAVELAGILDYLHQNKKAHGYITPRTLYVDDLGKPVLWGLYAYAKKDLSRFGRWNECFPPEYPNNDPVATDIYQFGIIVKLLIKTLPEGENNTPTYRKLNQLAELSVKKMEKRVKSAKELLVLLKNNETLKLTSNKKQIMSKSTLTIIIAGAVVVLAIAMVLIFKDNITGDATPNGKKKNNKDMLAEYVIKADGYFTGKNVIMAKVYYDSAATVATEDAHVKSQIIACNQIMSKIDKLVPVKNATGKFGYSNAEGYLLIDYLYEEVKKFKDDITAVKKDGKWGFIDKLGNVKIDFRFTAINQTFSPGYKAMVVENGKCIMINKSGDFVKNCP